MCVCAWVWVLVCVGVCAWVWVLVCAWVWVHGEHVCVCLVRPCIGIKKFPCCESFSFLCMYNNIFCKLLVDDYDKWYVHEYEMRVKKKKREKKSFWSMCTSTIWLWCTETGIVFNINLQLYKHLHLWLINYTQEYVNYTTERFECCSHD